MLIIGHRGARGLAPENTLAALRKGLEHHVDELEFDVRVTKDHIPVLNHDAQMHNPDGHELEIAQHSYEELLAHKRDLLTLKEALQELRNTVPLYIEVKPGEPVKPIIRVIKDSLQQGTAKDMLRLGSFSQQTLLQLHAALPEIEKIVIEHWSGVRATRRARQLNTKRIVLDQRWIWFGFVRAVARGGYQLGVYTLNSPKKARRWEKYGLAAVCTDYPDLFENK